MTEAAKDVVLDFLAQAEMEVLGLLPYASNATLLARMSLGDVESLAVYKPRKGERPLWDFPSGTLCLREFAAWLVSEELGWDIVPPTTLREGPAGFGAVQLFVEEDGDTDVRMLPQSHPEELQKMALFDVIVNNTDRKAGHLIVDTRGKLWGVDHGICFSDEPKLRTVVWVYESEEIPVGLLEDVERFARSGAGASSLGELLNAAELEALCERTSEVLRTKRYPAPDPYGRHIPWPPW
jgi:hypothetical protein